jgi:dolichol kinase
MASLAGTLTAVVGGVVVLAALLLFIHTKTTPRV